jgi:HEAT repeat protein
LGILDAFSKESRIQRSVARNVKKLTNKWVHADERSAAIQNLRGVGTEEAIEGLLLRFNFVIDNTTVDEEEKQRVKDILVEFGERSISPVLAYIRKSDTLTWALKVLCELEDESKVVDQLIQILADIDPLDKKAAERQIQIIHQLGEMNDPRLFDSLLPLLRDDNEDVQFHIMEALERLGDPRAAPALVQVAIEEESIRLRGRALQAISSRGWPVGDRRDELAKRLPPNHYIDKDGTIRNRLEEVLTGLRSADAKERRFAARDATLLDKPDEAMDALIDAMTDSDASVRATVAASLAKVGDFRAREVLENALHDRDSDVRRKAEDALRHIRKSS